MTKQCIKLQGDRSDPELGKGRPDRFVHASKPAYKQMVKDLYAFLSACALLPQGGNATYNAWWMAKCIL